MTGTGSTLEIGEGDERLDGLRVHLGALGAVTEVTLRTEPAFALAETVELLPVAQVRERAQEIGASAEFVKVWWMPHTPTALLFRFERTREPPTRWPSAATQRVIENWLPRAILPAVFARHERRPGGVPAFNRVAARWLARSRRVGPSVLMLTGPYPVRHHETEAAVPLGAAGEAFDRVVSLIDRTGLAVNFILELRYGRGDSSWMSPAYGGDVAYLGACTAMTPQRRTYFDGFWQEIRQLRGRPHWGKEMDHDASEIADLYPMVGRFGALRQDLDPERVFANSFLDRILGT